MSRNALAQFIQVFCRLTLAGALWLASRQAQAADLSLRQSGDSPRTRRYRRGHKRHLPIFSRTPRACRRWSLAASPISPARPTVAEAWRSLVSTQDVVGIKVYSEAGAISGTRPAVVAAVVRGLLDADVPPSHIIIWDKRANDLRAAGFFKLAAQLGVHAAGCVETGYDPTNFYLPDSPIIGNLVWGDLEFGKKGRKRRAQILRRPNLSAGKSPKSSASRRCSTKMPPASAGIFTAWRWAAWTTPCGSRATPDGWPSPCRKFTRCPRSATASCSNITDALIGQYEGGAKGLLQYSSVLNQLWFSRDPVALDTLAIAGTRPRAPRIEAPEFKPNLGTLHQRRPAPTGRERPCPEFRWKKSVDPKWEMPKPREEKSYLPLKNNSLILRATVDFAAGLEFT